VCLSLSVCPCLSVCPHNNGLPGQKNIAKLGVSQTAIFAESLFCGFIPLFLCLLFCLFLMYRTDNIRTQSITLNIIDDVGDTMLMTRSSMLMLTWRSFVLESLKSL